MIARILSLPFSRQSLDEIETDSAALTPTSASENKEREREKQAGVTDVARYRYGCVTQDFFCNNGHRHAHDEVSIQRGTSARPPRKIKKVLACVTHAREMEEREKEEDQCARQLDATC